jgi:predicted ArsR family transcriptional regulator
VQEGPAELDAEEIRVAKSLSDVDLQGESITAEDLARRLHLHTTKMKYLLDRLEKSGFVAAALFIGSPARYRLSSTGRAYLVEHNLL